MTTTSFVDGDVLSYETLTRPDRWCREGIAVVIAGRRGIRAFDTFWDTSGGGSEAHELTEDELATAVLMFNPADYDALDPLGRFAAADEWKRYAAPDREVITSQHGLVRCYYVRKGARPDIDMQIANAREALAEANEELKVANVRAERALTTLLELEETKEKSR